VRAAHTAFGAGLAILLYCHGGLPGNRPSFLIEKRHNAGFSAAA
jgi:hypothetical protein